MSRSVLALDETVEERLTADLEHLARYRNSHRGERIWILGTGRSIADIPDLASLAREITIGVNYLPRWTNLPFNPMYWCMSEWAHQKTVHRLLRDRGIWPRARFIASADLCGWPQVRVRDPELAGWLWIPRDISHPIAHGYLSGIHPPFDATATGAGVVFECAVQVAAWMGAREIVLLGVDADHRGHVYDPPGTTDNDAIRGDIPHIAKITRDILATAGVQLVNGTPGGKLDSIPRSTVSALLER